MTQTIARPESATTSPLARGAKKGFSSDMPLLLAVWQYMEYSQLRIIAGWGRRAGDWEDKLAVCYHVWLQAEIVNRFRKRLEQFPPHKPERPVNAAYEALANAVLDAPSWPSAMRGVYTTLSPALTRAYEDYLTQSHPVHDRPTHEMLREILNLKNIQEEWYEGFQKRMAADGHAAYLANVEDRLEAVHHLHKPLPATTPPAALCGKNIDFRMPETPGRVQDWNAAPNIMPFLEKDWAHSVEARRLYFMIGYFWEMGVAESQLRWIYYADFMPWEFIHAEARHLWDESRHGDSGLTRLRDFGLDIADVGYNSYGARGEGTLPPMTPQDLFESFYFITQVAEMGFFKTKRYCMEDFANGGDAASAEMMEFDILDETTHVEYGRMWLTALAEKAGVECDWNQRGARDREAAQARSDARVAALREYAAAAGEPSRALVIEDEPAAALDRGAHAALHDPAARAHYERLLGILREKKPLTNAANAPVRPNLPM